MIISTKGRYALRVMVDLAEHPSDGFTPLQEIADRLHISKEYLNSILKLLVKHNQLTSLRGKGGGYRLNNPPETYRVGTILRIVEDNMAPVACVQEDHQCPNAVQCRSYGMWKALDDMINDYFDNIYLTDFLENGRFAPAASSMDEDTCPSIARSAVS